MIMSASLFAVSCVYKLDQSSMWCGNVKTYGHSSLLMEKSRECSKYGLTNGLVFSFSSGVCECLRGAGEVLFTASESVASEAKLTQINFQKVRYKTVACGGEKILIQSTSFKSHIPGFVKTQSVLIRVPFCHEVLSLSGFPLASPRFDSLPASAVCSLSSKSRTKSQTWESFGLWHTATASSAERFGKFAHFCCFGNSGFEAKRWLRG